MNSEDATDKNAVHPTEATAHPYLTPDDTWCMWVDSYGMRRYWATIVDETVVERDSTEVNGGEVRGWSVELIDDESGDRFTVDHEAMLTAMLRIVDERDAIQLADVIIDQVAAVLNARDRESATDELCQLDVIGNDAIVQVATLGRVIYG
jgi:hypothetical protein